MSFKIMFENFEKNLLSYFEENNFVEVPKNTLLLDKQYSILRMKPNALNSFFTNCNSVKLVKDFLNLNDSTAKELEDFLFLTGDIFKNTSDVNDNSRLGIGVGKNAVKEEFFMFKFLNNGSLIRFSEKDGLKFKNSLFIGHVDGVALDSDVDINLIFKEALNNYKAALIKTSGMDFVDFASFIEYLNGVTFSDLVNKKIKSEHFKLVDPELIVSVLEQEKQSLKKTTFTVNNNIFTFFKDDTHSLLGVMKKMLSSTSYNNFTRAANFFHTYQSLMNTNKTIKIIYNNSNHKLQEIQNSFFSIVIDDAITIQVNIPDATSNVGLFEIYTFDSINYAHVNSIDSTDLSEIFDYVFDFYSKQLSSCLDKPISEFNMGDVPVLIMANF